jgi:hypothetical protein
MVARSDVTGGRALGRAQSTTSLRRLLRDTAGFVWRYAAVPDFEQQPLVLPPSVFGELVHELMRHAIEALESDPHVSRASETEFRNAVEAAVEVIAGSWPLAPSLRPPTLSRAC